MAIMQEQDEQLDQVYHTVANLKNMAHTIGDELDDQGLYVLVSHNFNDQSNQQFGGTSGYFAEQNAVGNGKTERHNQGQHRYATHVDDF